MSVRKYLFLVKRILVLQTVFLVGCTVHSIHNTSYVSNSIHNRTGHDLNLIKEKGIFELPANISLEDGLTGDEAVAIALWNNAQFQADIMELGFARADLIEAGLLRNPVFSLLFPLGPKQLEATLNLPLEFFWQRPKRVAAAKLNVEGVADNLVQHGLNLTRDVMIAYAELVFTRERSKIVSEEAALRGEIAAIASARLKVGDISELEETAFRLEAARMQEASVRFTRNAKLAEERLKTLLGLGMTEVTLELSLVPVSYEQGLDSSELLNTAFAARPDLRAAEIAIEAVGHRLGWERSRIFNLTGMLDANGEGKEGFEMGPGVQLELPVFNWNNGKILRAQTELEQAARQYVAVKHRIAREVIEAYTNYLAAQQALKILRVDILPSAQTATENAEGAYSVGEISYLEFLDFKRSLLDSLLREAEAEAELRRAEAYLRHSIGFTSLKTVNDGI